MAHTRLVAKKKKANVSAVDLFCGAGGLTHGFMLEGIKVNAGIDSDPICEYPYEQNNKSEFIHRDVTELEADDLRGFFAPGDVKLLAGCAPCQPFSTYSQGHRNQEDEKWKLLYSFARLAKDLRPEIVTMENVPKLVEHEVFQDFVEALQSLNYTVSYAVVDCLAYGIPQRRKRLVLFASIYGEVTIEEPTHKPATYRTVRDVLEALPVIKAGEVSKSDPLHRSSRLFAQNLERIQASRPGGTWRDWDESLITKCHKKKSGKTYPSVYGRMKWDEPAPTITTQCFGFGNGRFGHPMQDRAISLREAALLQTFPPGYVFAKTEAPLPFKKTGKLIGNAVPVDLARIIARSILRHLRSEYAQRPALQNEPEP
jgi:DNA (cytosine-5)-methyltransferase 1